MPPKTQEPVDQASNVQSVDDEGWETVVEPYGETYAFENAGDTLTGTYKGSKEVDTEDLNNPGETRAQTVYEIVDENGKLWSVWSSFNIEQGMEAANPNDMVRIRFDGKVPIDNGKRSVKTFTIAVKRT